jgi:hypothetical protein
VWCTWNGAGNSAVLVGLVRWQREANRGAASVATRVRPDRANSPPQSIFSATSRIAMDGGVSQENPPDACCRDKPAWSNVAGPGDRAIHILCGMTWWSSARSPKRRRCRPDLAVSTNGSLRKKITAAGLPRVFDECYKVTARSEVVSSAVRHPCEGVSGPGAFPVGVSKNGVAQGAHCRVRRRVRQTHCSVERIRQPA